MQYGSIGWSVGATLGYAQAAKDKRVIACIGDGSFQVSDNFDMKYGDPCPCSIIALLNLDIGFLCVGI
jgi:thiamine pyrophosphate-dependent acetolactate synthase large subunit-like protein